jgi:hypothetical protein
MMSRLRRLIGRLRELLNLPARVQAESRKVARDSHADARTIQLALKDQARRLEDVRTRQSEQYAELEREIRSVHAEIHDRLLQYHLQLGRLTSLLEGRTTEPQFYSAAIPFAAESPSQSKPVAPAAGEWLELSQCQGCGTVERTIVCKWNKSILADQEPQDDSTTSNYALCHGCGIVYATRRPLASSIGRSWTIFPTRSAATRAKPRRTRCSIRIRSRTRTVHAIAA